MDEEKSKNKMDEEILNKLVVKNSEEIQLSKLEQWKIYVKMADNISSRRVSANNFFLTSNSLLIIAISFMIEFLILEWVFLPLVIGLFFSISWNNLISSYRSLNSAKYKVINEIENHLHFRGYSVEWELLKFGKSSFHKPLSKIENCIPRILGFVYLFSIGVLAFHILN